jgi:hypothetical protein
MQPSQVAITTPTEWSHVTQRSCLRVVFKQLTFYYLISYLFIYYYYYYYLLQQKCGPGSSVGIATGYGLDGPGIEFRRGKIFRTCPDRPWGPPSPLYNGYRVFPGGKERPGRDADPLPPSSAVVKKR